MKPIVHYIGTPKPKVGEGVILFPLDHPDTEMVSNTKPVFTSPVIHVDKESGRIETQNTVYVPSDVQDADIWRQSGAL